MDHRNAFEQMIEILQLETHVSIFAKAELLADMGVNPQHLAETTGRKLGRRHIIVRGSDGMPLGEIEFEFLPIGGNT